MSVLGRRRNEMLAVLADLLAELGPEAVPTVQTWASALPKGGAELFEGVLLPWDSDSYRCLVTDYGDAGAHMFCFQDVPSPEDAVEGRGGGKTYYWTVYAAPPGDTKERVAQGSAPTRELAEAQANAAARAAGWVLFEDLSERETS